jgi:hypothetical protein
VRELLTVVSCEHPDCTAQLAITETQLAYDTETDVLRYAGWMSIHGAEHRCPDHRADLPT